MGQHQVSPQNPESDLLLNAMRPEGFLPAAGCVPQQQPASPKPTASVFCAGLASLTRPPVNSRKTAECSVFLYTEVTHLDIFRRLSGTVTAVHAL